MISDYLSTNISHCRLAGYPLDSRKLGLYLRFFLCSTFFGFGFFYVGSVR